MGRLFDSYTWQARVLPGLIALLPIAFAYVACVPLAIDTAKPLIGLASGAGLLVLLAQLSRAAGKKSEKMLFGGVLPTTNLLRYADTELDAVTKARYKAKLAELVPNISMPSLDEEHSDPASADDVYTSCASFLRARTRDNAKFPLVYKENIAYGFSRNLYGLKPIGICCALVGVAACAWRAWREHLDGATPAAITLLALIGCVIMLLVWALSIRSSWVKSAGLSYALRLLETLDSP